MAAPMIVTGFISGSAPPIENWQFFRQIFERNVGESGLNLAPLNFLSYGSNYFSEPAARAGDGDA